MKLFFIVLSLLALTFVSACGRNTVKPETAPTASAEPATQAQMAELKNIITNLNSRMDGLETKINAHENKLAEKTPLKTSPSTPIKAVSSMPSDVRGQELVATEVPSDPERGFAHGPAIQAFRKAKIDLDSKRYPEAVLAFTQFMDRYADHILAGQAQYYIGLAYAKQNEHKLAAQEFHRVLTAYDRSPYVAETLRALADSEDAIGKKDEAARHRQMLHAMFPQSPAARLVQGEAKTAQDSHGPDETTPPTAPQKPAPMGEPAPKETPEASSDHT